MSHTTRTEHAESALMFVRGINFVYKSFVQKAPRGQAAHPKTPQSPFFPTLRKIIVPRNKELRICQVFQALRKV